SRRPELFVLRQGFEEDLSTFSAGSSGAGRNKCWNVGGTRLGCGADINRVGQIGRDCGVPRSIRRSVQNDNFDSQIAIKVALEGGVVVHVVESLDDDGRSRGQTRVAGLKLQDAVVKFVSVGRVQIAKNVNDYGLRFGLLATGEPQEQ